MSQLFIVKRRRGDLVFAVLIGLVFAGACVTDARADCRCGEPFDIKLTGSHFDSTDGFELADTERALAGIGANASFDAPLQLGLQGNLNEVMDADGWRDAGNHTEARRLADAQASAGLFDGNMSWTTNLRVSSSSETNAYSEGEARAEQHRFKADVLRWEKNRLTISGSSSRVDADYRDLYGRPLNDTLQKNNSAAEQIGANLTLGRIKLSAADKSSTALRADTSGFRSHNASTEFGASIGLMDVRSVSPRGLAELRLLAPDTLWVTQGRGVTHDGDPANAADPTDMWSLGASRSWTGGSVRVSRWQSTQRSPQSTADGPLWAGSGVDVGSEWYGQRWSLSSTLSLYDASRAAQWNHSADSSVSGSVFATRRMTHWPDLSAGIVVYQYRTEVLDYDGLDLNDFMRYQVALDFSRMVPTMWSGADSKLKLVGSYQKNVYRYQWTDVNYANSAGGVAIGLQYTVATF